MLDDPGAAIAIKRRSQNRAIELLLGIVTGMIADETLHDKEIQFLRSWLQEHPDVAAVWPGSIVAATIRDTLSDGIITEPERAHLLKVLQSLSVNDFSITGSAASEVLQLPIDDTAAINVQDRHVCHTGEFLYGTRAKCEQLTVSAGGTPTGTVTKKVSYLVVGTNVSPSWAHSSFGRKIEQAIALQQAGHHIAIVSEQRWLNSLKN